jgi:hypothetical protein
MVRNDHPRAAQVDQDWRCGAPSSGIASFPEPDPTSERPPERRLRHRRGRETIEAHDQTRAAWDAVAHAEEALSAETRVLGGHARSLAGGSGPARRAAAINVGIATR